MNTFDFFDDISDVFKHENISTSDMFDFSNEAAKSALNYYNYLKNKKGGREEIRAIAITEISNNLFEVKLGNRLYSPDGAALCVRSGIVDREFYIDTNERFINNAFVKIVTNNKLSPSVCIETKGKFTDIFRLLRPEQVFFVSDLTFLVKNVEKWHEKFGHSMVFPPKPNISLDNMFTRGIESDEQLQAQQTVLSKPISYVWGAPGTGKTQIVLVNSILSYINRKQRVYIVAPTNNAVEQVLRSVINVLNEIGQEDELKYLYRMGTSSEEFAREHGRICERFDKLEQLKSIREEIKWLENKYREIQKSRQIKASRDRFYSLLPTYREKSEILPEITQKTVTLQTQLENKKQDLYSAKTYFGIVVKQYDDLIKKESTFSFKVSRKFNKTKAEQHEKEKFTLKTTTSDTNNRIIALEKNISDMESQLYELDIQLNELTADMEIFAKQFGECALCLTDENISVDKLKYLLDHAVLDKTDEDSSAIEKRLNECKNIISITSQQEQANMAGKLVCAFTIDYLIAHFEDFIGMTPNLRPHHIFLDEAAYCPMIKAGVLFALNVPVTMLGDHMQLPPICEAREETLKQCKNNIFMWSQSAIYFPQTFEDDITMNDLFTQYKEKKPPSYCKMNISILTKTYRFGNQLSQILDEFVYKNGFQSGLESETSIIVLNAPRPMQAENNRENIAEVCAIKDFISATGIQNFAIITPYKDQMDLLRAKIIGVDRDDIITIHRSQGREWDTVIISVSDSIKGKWFTNSKNHKSDGLKIINTAVSRAKKQIVLVCDAEQWSTLSDSQLIGRIISSPTSKIIDY